MDDADFFWLLTKSVINLCSENLTKIIQDLYWEWERKGCEFLNSGGILLALHLEQTWPFSGLGPGLSVHRTFSMLFFFFFFILLKKEGSQYASELRMVFNAKLIPSENKLFLRWMSWKENVLLLRWCLACIMWKRWMVLMHVRLLWNDINILLHYCTVKTDGITRLNKGKYLSSVNLY